MTSLFFKHHPHSGKTLFKFLALLAILIGYFAYLSWKFDIQTGGWIAALSWSFFVLCTPVADAGFLLDFPIRLVTGIRMIMTEILVWGIAIGLNAITIWTYPELYQTTFLTDILYKILTNPFPYWSIVILCGLGTFLSIHFGDEVYNSVAGHNPEIDPHKQKNTRRKLILSVVLFGIIFGLYILLLRGLDIRIPEL